MATPALVLAIRAFNIRDKATSPCPARNRKKLLPLYISKNNTIQSNNRPAHTPPRSNNTSSSARQAIIILIDQSPSRTDGLDTVQFHATSLADSTWTAIRSTCHAQPNTRTAPPPISWCASKVCRAQYIATRCTESTWTTDDVATSCIQPNTYTSTASLRTCSSIASFSASAAASESGGHHDVTSVSLASRYRTTAPRRGRCSVSSGRSKIAPRDVYC